MSANTDLIYNVKRKMLAKYPRFGSEIAVANIEFKDNLKYHTAATDGKNIYVDPNYFASLSENDRLFTIAHEIMHIKFMHMFRLKDKSGVKRDPELWNIATDAIINANLERDGFTIKEGYVNMPEALDYSAEEFYQKLLQEKEKKSKNKKMNKIVIMKIQNKLKIKSQITIKVKEMTTVYGKKLLKNSKILGKKDKDKIRIHKSKLKNKLKNKTKSKKRNR